MAADDLLAAWHYYSIEYAPGRIARGQYEDSLPMLPRIFLRGIDVAGMDCLDVGTMEGLVPVLLAKRGAKASAIDYGPHCERKRRALMSAHGYPYRFAEQGTAYGLDRVFFNESFDLINLSGLLYHVVSPLMVLLGIRPLLKRNALLIVSTNVIAEAGMYAEFNAHGRMQIEANTFWYPTIELLHYWLRMLRLQPVDNLFMPHSAVGKVMLNGIQNTYTFDKRSGYLSILCRAVDDAPQADGWMKAAIDMSVDFQRLTDWKRAAAQPVSAITYAGPQQNEMRVVTEAHDHHESHLLMLEDTY